MPATIEELRNLKPDWDSYGAPAIDQRAIDVAEKIISVKPQLIPCNDGGVQVDFIVNSEEYSVTLKPDGSQEFDEPISRKRLEAWLVARKWKRYEPDPRYWEDPKGGGVLSKLRDAIIVQLDRDEQAAKQEAKR